MPFYLLGASFFEQTIHGGGAKVERYPSAVLAPSSLGGMVQRCLGEGRSVMEHA
jgi:hypothetical protein